jgi:hypothetical protein
MMRGRYLAGMEWNKDPGNPTTGGFVKELPTGERVIVAPEDMAAATGQFVPFLVGDIDDPILAITYSADGIPLVALMWEEFT